MTDAHEPAVDVALVVLLHGDRVLVRPRPHDDSAITGLLEFPGGHVEPGETPQRAAAREFTEETGLAAEHLQCMEIIEHGYPERRLRLHFYTAVTRDGRAPTGWYWCPLRDLEPSRVPTPNQPIIERLLRKITRSALSDCSDLSRLAQEPPRD